MNNDSEDTLEPLAVTIETTSRITGESKSQVYIHILDGVYDARKSGRRTLITFASIKRRVADLPKLKLARRRRYQTKARTR